jgi:uncharacterized protein YebE (UPF0316 family)
MELDISAISFFDSQTFTLVVLPVLIFLARVCDVTIGTLRLISVSRGYKFLAPILGFFEVLIWIIVIGKVMENLSNWICYVAYAGGFATGNFVGICIEEKIAMGTFMIRVITQRDGTELIRSLNDAGYGATNTKAEGAEGPVSIIFSIINRGDLSHVIELIRQFNPNAFYTIEDVRFVKEGIFPARKSLLKKTAGIFPKMYRKGK